MNKINTLYTETPTSMYNQREWFNLCEIVEEIATLIVITAMPNSMNGKVKIAKAKL